MLANSSFEYFPGAPVHVSDDMLHWRQVGNVVTRPEQADLTAGSASSGIYGSTIRYHGGKYWFITTNIAQVREGQRIYSADSPEGPWSDGVFARGLIGIDPDLAWDDDGTCYLTWCGFPGGIKQVTVSPATGEVLSEPVSLWSGTGMRNPEGPHLYHVGDWWYLMIAEGGTGLGHSVSVARSRSPQGPYEAYEHNPILTHRSTDHPVQSTGHADLVEGDDGQWWGVFHGVRPGGIFPNFHRIGRETLVSPVEWVDGWPQFRERDLGVRARTSFTDDFSGELAHHWVVAGSSLDGITTSDQGLTLTAADTPGLELLTRVQDLNWAVTVDVDVAHGDARLVLRLDQDHWYGLDVTADRVTAVAHVGPLHQELGSRPVADPSAVSVTLTVTVPPKTMLGWDAKEPDLVDLAGLVELDGRYVSTEVAGGFTGRMVGIRALRGVVGVRLFSYEGRDSS